MNFLFISIPNWLNVIIVAIIIFYLVYKIRKIDKKFFLKGSVKSITLLGILGMILAICRESLYEVLYLFQDA